MKHRKFLLIICSLLMWCGTAYADHVPGEVIAIFKPRSPESISTSSISIKNAKITQTFNELSKAADGIFTVIHSDTIPEEDLLKDLLARPDVIGASLNRKYKISDALIPDDSLYESLWGMEAINAPEAWDISTGSDDVYVVVIDSGVDYTHSDLAANYSHTYSRNFTSGKINNPDDHGHGTHVSGIIGAIGDNAEGVAGVNWRTKIISIRIMDKKGEARGDEIISALNYTLTLLNSPEIGPKIAAINMSFGSELMTLPPYATDIRTDPEYIAMKAIGKTNRAVMCIAAGNDGCEIGEGIYTYPASLVGIDNMIVVAAATSDDNRNMADFSNYSAKHVDIAAPGENILSTVPIDCTEVNEHPDFVIQDKHQNYIVMEGTSMATPHVAGTAALIKSIAPNAKASDIKNAILNSANSDYATYYTKYGFLDVKAALDNIQVIKTKSIPDAFIGAEYSFQFEATNPDSVTKWEIVEGFLPGSFNLSESGLLSGKADERNSFDFTVQVSGANLNASRKFTLNVYDNPKILVNMDTIPVFTAEGVPPFTWEISSGKLPDGLSLNSSTGEIIGEPKKAGTFYFTIKLSNSYGSDTKNYAVTVINTETGFAIDGDWVEADPPAVVAESNDDKTEVLNKILYSFSDLVADGTEIKELIAENVLYLKERNASEVSDTEQTLIPKSEKIVKLLPLIRVEEAAVYVSTIILDELESGIPISLHISSSSVKSASNEEISGLFNSKGVKITTLPGDKKVNVAMYLKPGKIYAPIITTNKTSSDEETTTSGNANNTEETGDAIESGDKSGGLPMSAKSASSSGGGCSTGTGLTCLMALAILLLKKNIRK